MKQEVIDKLPPDAKKQFLKYAIKLSEKKTKSKVHDDFLSFVKHVWPEFIEGRHHKKIADKFNKLANGEIKRLIINMPPIEEVITNKKTNINPIWIMRQAGRYLPEFREIRKVNNDFIKLCLNQDLSSEITLQPLKRYDLDAAIIFLIF